MIPQAIAAGTFAGAILLFFSHVAPSFGAANYIRDTDEPRIFGRIKSRREAHLIGALVHLLTSLIAGFAYGLFVKQGVVSGFHFLPILGWSMVIGMFIGGVVMPIEGHGIFGVKEDAWFPVDLIVTQILWAGLFWWIVNLWPIM